MQRLNQALAIAGGGLEGDRYCTGEGSFNRGYPTIRPLTLINYRFVAGTPHEHTHRRNIAIAGIELMYAFGRYEKTHINIGNVVVEIHKYCDPCDRPDKLAGTKGFKNALQDCGGVVANVIEGGIIRIGDTVIPPPKKY